MAIARVSRMIVRIGRGDAGHEYVEAMELADLYGPLIFCTPSTRLRAQVATGATQSPLDRRNDDRPC
jgi:hypothetical protein